MTVHAILKTILQCNAESDFHGGLCDEDIGRSGNMIPTQSKKLNHALDEARQYVRQYDEELEHD
jgi:hypothetical protein